MMFLVKIKKLIIALLIKIKYSRKKRNKNLWIFGEWFGEKCFDNCAFFANYVAENTENIDLVWIAKESTDRSFLNEKVRYVEMNTKEAEIVLSQAGVAVMGQGFSDFSDKKYNYLAGALTVNLWHGIPWKKLGKDRCTDSKNNVFYKLYRELMDWAYGVDFYLATSERYCEIVRTAFGAKENNIIRAGYPRNIIFYNYSDIKRAREYVLKEINSLIKNKVKKDVRIVTYMPTFRDNTSEMFSFKELVCKKDFTDKLIENNIVIVEKSHFVNQKIRKNSEEKSELRWISMQNISAQILLAATDLLITDYSGCFFDYTLLNRPIIHYLYDYEKYKYQDRGLYYEKEEVVAGTVVTKKEELIEEIIRNLDNPALYEKRRKMVREKYLTYDNKNNSKNIYEYILKSLNNKKIVGEK